MNAHVRRGIALVGVLALAGLAFWFSRPRPVPGGLPDHIEMFCVETGRFVALDRERVRGLPVVNPETGNATLLPFFLEDDGTRTVSARHRPYLEQLKERNRHVNPETLVIDAQP